MTSLLKSWRDAPLEWLLMGLLIAYSLASLSHYTHNAVYLERYPNMPAWITRSGVMAAWSCVAAVGLSGWLLWRFVHRLIGLAVLGLYAGLAGGVLAGIAALIVLWLAMPGVSLDALPRMILPVDLAPIVAAPLGAAIAAGFGARAAAGYFHGQAARLG